MNSQTRNLKVSSPMTTKEANAILSANFATDTLPQFANVPRHTDTILVSAWMPSTVKANRKAYGIHHATPTLKFNRKDLQMACQIAEQDPFQRENSVWVANLIDSNCLIIEWEAIADEDLGDLEYESGLFDCLPRWNDDRPAVTTRVKSFVSSCRSVLNYSSCRL